MDSGCFSHAIKASPVEVELPNGTKLRLSGGAGDDKLQGGSDGGSDGGFDDVLIRGDGKDDLKAGNGDDLLIADIWADADMILWPCTMPGRALERMKTRGRL